jgi:hypothetical protein
MKEENVKTCKYFRCNKEVYSPKAKFCGEHERFYREHRKTIGSALLTLGGIALSTLVKKQKK